MHVHDWTIIVKPWYSSNLFYLDSPLSMRLCRCGAASFGTLRAVSTSDKGQKAICIPTESTLKYEKCATEKRSPSAFELLSLSLA